MKGATVFPTTTRKMLAEQILPHEDRIGEYAV